MSCYYGFIENIDDALVLIEAAHKGKIPMLRVRLTAEQRTQVQSGSTFIFNESAGMKRWTDGLTWSPSRFSDGFFLYRQIPQFPSARQLKKNQTEEIKSYSHETRIEHTLRKKVISVGVENSKSRIHLVNYYTDADVSNHVLPIPSKTTDFRAFSPSSSKLFHISHTKQGVVSPSPTNNRSSRKRSPNHSFIHNTNLSSESRLIPSTSSGYMNPGTPNNESIAPFHQTNLQQLSQITSQESNALPRLNTLDMLPLNSQYTDCDATYNTRPRVTEDIRQLAALSQFLDL